MPFSLQRIKATVMLLVKLAITTFVAGAFLYTAVRFYPEIDFHFKGFIAFVFLYVLLFFAFVSTYRAFRFGISRYREIMFSYILSVLLTNCFTYLVLSLTAKAMLRPWALVACTFVQIAGGFLLNKAGDALYFRVHPVRDCILVLSPEGKERDAFGGFEAIRNRYRILETVSESIGEEELFRRILPYPVVIAGRLERGLRDRLTERCFADGKRLFYLAEVSDVVSHSSQETFIGDSLLYLCKNRVMTEEQRILKRAIDLAVSALGILVTSPVMLITALLIKAWDGGPVLFRQERYTQSFATFVMLKFRSMVPDAEKDGARFTVPDDERITPIGRFIRKTRIDELPQLFNILRGEMSLVGPRAERVENVRIYCDLMPEFRYRMKVKAGLTGYAQIYGRYNTSYEDKLKMDLFYIENYSVLRDLQLLFTTLKVLFMEESTEGFSQGDPERLLLEREDRRESGSREM